MLLHALYERLRMAPLNRLPCYDALEVIVTLLLLLLLLHCALASCSAVYCNRSCLWICLFVGVFLGECVCVCVYVCVCVCVFVGLLPR